MKADIMNASLVVKNVRSDAKAETKKRVETSVLDMAFLFI